MFRTVFLVLLLTPTIVLAQSVPVNTPYYTNPAICQQRTCVYVSPAGNDTMNDGMTDATPLRSIQEALDMVKQQQQQTSGTNVTKWNAPVLLLSAGVYAGGITWRGANVVLTSMYGAMYTTIDCNGKNQRGVYIGADESAATELSGVTITNCQAVMGGGIAVVGVDTQPLIKDVRLHKNNATALGGGFAIVLSHPRLLRVEVSFCLAPDGAGLSISTNTEVVVLLDCSIHDNIAPGAAGAIAIRNAYVSMHNTSVVANRAGHGTIFSDGSRLNMYACLIHGNTVTLDEGGGLYSVRSLIQIFDSKFIDNKCLLNGGGISVRLPRDWGTLRGSLKYEMSVYRTLFESNRALSDGGAVTIKELTAYFEDCEFRHNIGANGAGGLYFSTDSVGTVVGSRFIGNTATSPGGGAALMKASTGTMRDCIFVNNTVTETGGAVLVQSKCKMTLINATMTGNAANTGAAVGVVSKGQVTWTNGIASNNIASGNGGGISNAGSTCTLTNVTLTYNAAKHGGALYLENPVAVTMTGNRIRSNRASVGGGGVYINQMDQLSANVLKVIKIENATNIIDGASNTSPYGPAMSTAADTLAWIAVDLAAHLDVSNQTSTSIPTSANSATAGSGSFHELTINNMDEIHFRIMVMDAYGQRVTAINNVAFGTAAIFMMPTSGVNNNTANQTVATITQVSVADITPMSTVAISPFPTMMAPEIALFEYAAVAAGYTSGRMVLAGTPGGSYLVTITCTSMSTIKNITLVLHIKPCYVLDTITYYPPGTTRYQLCQATPVAYVSSALFNSIVVITAALMFLTVIVLIILVIFRNHSVMKAATPWFLVILMCGALIGYFAVILMNIDLNRVGGKLTALSTRDVALYDEAALDSLRSVCRAQYWILSTGLVLMFATCLLKTRRIYIIFCNTHIELINAHSTAWMSLGVGVAVAIEMLINGIWLGTEPLDIAFSTETNHVSALCTTSSLTWPIISIVYKAVIVLACVWHGYMVRAVVSTFNESRQLMSAGYNLMVGSAVTLILVIVLPDTTSKRTAFSFGALFVLTSTWMIVMLPKLLILGLGRTGSSEAGTNKGSVIATNGRDSNESQLHSSLRKPPGLGHDRKASYGKASAASGTGQAQGTQRGSSVAKSTAPESATSVLDNNHHALSDERASVIHSSVPMFAPLQHPQKGSGSISSISIQQQSQLQAMLTIPSSPSAAGTDKNRI